MTWLTFDPILIEPAIVKRGRPTIGERAMTRAEHKKKERAKAKAEKLDRIAILDMETDPFDPEGVKLVYPFLAVLYSQDFDPIIIWENNPQKFIDKLMAALNDLPHAYTIYAHNGGKFDFMFLLHRLRGDVKFKGRGIMSAKIGRHELRDSFHIIPEKLANYQKDDIDYTKLQKNRRNKFKREIIDYCISDCRYLLEIVKRFVGEHGFKISIGQAAISYLRKTYKVDRIGEAMDGFLRGYFFGGRVECLEGAGHFVGHYKLYDVNSMYPFVMANYQHPIGNLYTIRDDARIGPNAIFVDLICENYGALVRRGDENETSGNFRDGRFLTTIWEYRVAKKYGLIKKEKILRTIECDKRTDFSKVIVPLYEGRTKTKALLKQLPKGSHDFNEAKKDDIILKLLMNNMYGKFAQNPRRYKEHYITDPGEAPEGEGWGDLPHFECADYWLWEKPNPMYRFLNVGTAASITGAARAVLLEAIHNSTDAIYCDTDSLICRDLRNVTIDGQELGAWDIEQEFDEVIICGKKLYACKVRGIADGHKDRVKVRSKGVSGRAWGDFVAMLDGKIIDVLNKGVTMNNRGQQFYMRRKIRATAPLRKRMRANLERARA